jgi:DNA-binding MarR family transcriptional regulator
MDFRIDQDRKQFIARMRGQIKTLFGIEDTSGFELFSMIRRLAHMSEALDSQPPNVPDLSGSRWRLMMHLLAEEHMGNGAGLTPTSISHSQRVSKNTISALLRGLEEQGLIQRNLDAADYRLFRIQLTQAGRDLVLTTAPQRLAQLNRLAAGLTCEEHIQLMLLLEKLHNSLADKACKTAHNPETESK